MFSVSIIALNAQKTLADCLSSIKDQTDDIVVVIDENTTDETESVAKKFTSKVFRRKFDTFSNQRNFAATKTKHNWVFVLDADEQYQGPKIHVANHSAYSFRRTNIMFGKPITHSNSDPNPIVRLYDKTQCHWVGDVHEQLQISGVVKRQSGQIFHTNYQTVEQFLDKANHYSNLESNFTNPIYDFLRRYIWHLGFLDGWHGLFFCYLQAIYHTIVWAKNI